jgi:tRNA threonylcarbamoyladenosine biosynthesis protein TsaE
MNLGGATRDGLPAILCEDPAAGRLELASPCEAATIELGRLLAGQLGANDVVSLDGGLGAGKTVLTRGIAAGLGCGGAVTSPTFTLLIEHPAKPDGLALYHFDAYRLDDAAAFCATGLDEYFYTNGVCVVEWGSQIAAVLPRRTLAVIIESTGFAEPEHRRVRLSWPDRPERLAALADLLRQSEKEKQTC